MDIRNLRFLRQDDGQAMVEYALILAFVALVTITTLSLIGSNVNTVFQSVVDGF